MKYNIKNIYLGFAIGCSFVATAALTSCNDFIDVEPQGVISEDLATFTYFRIPRS